MRNNKSNAILYVMTAFRDGMIALSNDSDPVASFHAKVMLHHFFHCDGKKKYDAIGKTSGALLIERALNEINPNHNGND